MIILGRNSQLFCGMDYHLESCELEGPDVDLSATDKCILHEVHLLMKRSCMIQSKSSLAQGSFGISVCDSPEYLPCSINCS